MNARVGSSLKLFAAWTTAVCLSAFLTLLPSHAGDRYWVGGTGSWEESFNWNPSGEPQDGENVFLTQSGTSDMTVDYVNSVNLNAVLGSLYIDSTGSGTTTLTQDSDSLITLRQYIGYSGSGSFVQTGGTNDNMGITLGYNVGSSGSYQLGGIASFWSHGGEIIGYSGSGTLCRQGGLITWVPDLAWAMRSQGMGHTS